MANPTAKQIWDKLSKINVNELTEEKGGLTYLSWGHAWSFMMENYPNLTVKWHGMTDDLGVTRDITTYQGGTASVSCTVTIGTVVREMWLPVMDYKNRAVANPDSRAISDSKQRCLVKCFAAFGLAHYLYCGLAIPSEAQVSPSKPSKANGVSKKPPKKTTPARASSKKKKEVSVDELVTKLTTDVNKLYNSGWVPDDNLKDEIRLAVNGKNRKKIETVQKIIDAAENLNLLTDESKEDSTDAPN